jgi:hypothetical protein
VTTKSATGQALTVVNQTVARATGALPPLPPPPSLP